ncbi:head-tail adaptor protein [uncultured Muribaculum sp.]|uniref:phage head completion protein n=1 Tax=uncultured Muribaculum sp. TaxID=1918613 RepID=UPI00267643D7|nr:head-tail adaptor protein [uncultured Muribaculum sp.]
MKYRLELLEPVTVINSFGEEVPTYNKVRTVAAERVKASGHRSEEVGEHFPDYRAEFNIRDAHPVKENWRVRQLGGYVYTVTNIIPNLDRGMKTLVCERLNP